MGKVIICFTVFLISSVSVADGLKIPTAKEANNIYVNACEAESDNLHKCRMEIEKSVNDSLNYFPRHGSALACGKCKFLNKNEQDNILKELFNLGYRNVSFFNCLHMSWK